MIKRIMKFISSALVAFAILFLAGKAFNSICTIPHMEVACGIGSFIFSTVISIFDDKKIITISGIGILAVIFIGLPLVNALTVHNTSSSSSQHSSKIVQSSSQTQISSQTGNNNAKVVINNGQNGEVNGNNFYGPGQAVQTNSTKNVQINSNNFYQ